MQRSYAQQISPYDNAEQAQAITGNLINRTAGFAAPLVKFGGGLLGMDSPLSGALTWGGIGAMAGGLAGPGGSAIGAGVGAGVGAMIGTTGYAAGFVYNNAMAGMQQQQQLNQTMRQNFGFMRGGGSGYGFSGSDMSVIGSQMRGMSHQVGQGGEMHSFGELTQLAGNMGRMGFAQNVTDVKQFTTKFRQMVDTLKTVSRELGTSLQEAQDMVVGMRQSGIFTKSDQVRMAHQIRSNSLAGVSMEASVSMMNYGSQVARSIGGLGNSGAFAGMRTIQQVGAAMKVGALSEEDIYNATGLRGEEGTQAYAQNQLSTSARFLKSGRGRWLTASMAGRNGKLDEASAEAFASGGFDVGDTRNRAYGNLSKVGRAGFIRNEGRLQSEMLNRFGGNLNVMALTGWAGSRGIDISAMGDRDMLFAQRQLGMGRDELEGAVKQANAMGDIGSYMRRQSAQDDYMKDISISRKNQGLEGVKNRFNQLREHAQGKVAGTAQDALNSLTSSIERRLNRIFGSYESSLDTELSDAYSKFSDSGGTDQASRKTVLRNRDMASMGRALQMGGANSKMSVDQYQRLMQNKAERNFVGEKPFGWFGGETNEHRLGMPEFKGKTQAQFDEYQKTVSSYAKGANSLATSPVDTLWLAKNKDVLTTPGAMERLGSLKGFPRMQMMAHLAAESGDQRAAGFLERQQQGKLGPNELQTWGALGNTVDRLNSGGAQGSGFDANGMRGLMNSVGEPERYGRITGGAADEMQASREKLVKPFRGLSKVAVGAVAGLSSLVIPGAGAGLSSLVMPALGAGIATGGNMLVDGLSDLLSRSGAEAHETALGKIEQSTAGQTQLFKMLSGDKDEINSAKQEFGGLARIDKDELDTGQSSRKEWLRNSLIASDLGVSNVAEYGKQLAGGGKLSAEHAKMLQDKYNLKGDAAKSAVLGTAQMVGQTFNSAGAQQDAVLRKEGIQGLKAMDTLKATGEYSDSGELRADISHLMHKRGVGVFADMASARGRNTKIRADLGDGELTDEKRKAYYNQEDTEAGLVGKTSAELGQIVQAGMADKGSGSAQSAVGANVALHRAREMRSASSTVANRGAGGAAAKWMGKDVDDDTMRMLASKRGDVGAQMALLDQSHVLDGMSKEQRGTFKGAIELAEGKNLSAADKRLTSEERNMQSRRTIKGLNADVAAEAKKKETEKTEKKDTYEAQNNTNLEKIATAMDGMSKHFTANPPPATQNVNIVASAIDFGARAVK